MGDYLDATFGRQGESRLVGGKLEFECATVKVRITVGEWL